MSKVTSTAHAARRRGMSVQMKLADGLLSRASGRSPWRRGFDAGLIGPRAVEKISDLRVGMVVFRHESGEHTAEGSMPTRAASRQQQHIFSFALDTPPWMAAPRHDFVRVNPCGALC